MKKRTEIKPLKNDHAAYRYCIFAVHANDQGAYWYDPEYKMFFYGFHTKASRGKYWKTIVEPQSVTRRSQAYMLVLMNVRGRMINMCEKVGIPRYADSAIIDVDVDHREIVAGLVNCTPSAR